MKPGWIIIWVVFALMAACRADTMELNSRFDRAPELVQGDRVFIENNEAGRVTTVKRQADGDYVVGLVISKDFAGKLTESARCYIINDPGQPNDKALDIRMAGNGGAMLAEGATMEGILPEQEAAVGFREELEKGLDALEHRLRKYGRDLEKLPQTEAYQDLRKTLREWLSEAERAGGDAREKIEKKWLPRIQRELEELRERLKKNGDTAPEQTPPEQEEGMTRI